ncbi:MAG: tyrosine-protein phosphatase [Victivallaceae bacterium]
MIDLHSHILPDIDDGPPDIAASVKMLESAKLAGIEKLAATSHYSPRCKANYPAAFREVEEHASRIGIELLRGCEYSLIDFAEVEPDALISLGGSRYVLFDLEQTFVPSAMFELLFKVKLSGFRPVIAHPERMVEPDEFPDFLAKLTENGIYIQVNAGSLLGTYGRSARSNAFYLLDRGCCHLIANDAHHSHGFRNREWLDILIRRCGAENAQLLCEINPGHMLANREPREMEPYAIGLAGFFRRLLNRR